MLQTKTIRSNIEENLLNKVLMSVYVELVRVIQHDNLCPGVSWDLQSLIMIPDLF